MNPAEFKKFMEEPSSHYNTDILASQEFSDAPSIIDGTDCFVISDNKAITDYSNELERLQKEYSDALEVKDTSRALALEEKIKELMFFFSQSHDRSGKSKKIRGEYVKVQNKIGNAIKYAITWMKKQDFPEVAEHFKTSIDPYANKIAYIPSGKNIKWHI